MHFEKTKSIVLSSLAIASLSLADGRPAETQSDWDVQMGAMSFAQTELLHTEDGSATFRAIPIASVAYKDFYWRGLELGYKRDLNPQLNLTTFVNVQSGLGLSGAPGSFGGNTIEADDMADGYQGIKDRDAQAELGLKLGWDFTRDYTLELEGRLGERGCSAKSVLKRNFRGENFKWTLSPFVAVRVLDSSFVDYYFGVSESEASASDSYKITSSYNPDDMGLAGSIGLSGMYRINTHWVFISKVEGQTLSSEIADSPLVRKRENLSASFGAIYKF
jgi:outer membrane protein